LGRFTSILFPQGDAPAGAVGEPGCFSDLHLDEIIAAINARHPEDQVNEFFHVPLRDVSAIEHRQQVFRDLECDEIRAPIMDFVGGMRTIRLRLEQAKELRHPLQRQGWFIYAIQTYCEIVASLREALARVPLASRGLRDLTQYLAEYVECDSFRNLVNDTESVQTALRGVHYVVHIQDLRVHVEKYDGQTDYSAGVATIFGRFATEIGKDHHARLAVPLEGPPEDSVDINHIEAQILECVADLYPDPFAQLAGFCQRNQRFLEPTIRQFDNEVRFYLYYLAFVRKLTSAGLSFSYPEVTSEPGVLSVDDACDLALTIKSTGKEQPLVGNAFRLLDAERVFVVTGPNQGGKTTFARTAGQCAYLASLGCPIPANRARLTLPDRIYTHFERQENLSTLHGKLEDELVRIHDILSRATATSLIIMNESFSSTTVTDALQIGTEIVGRIIRLGCIAVYVSFLDELASVDRACVSMVGEVAPDDPSQRTFKFTRRPADGLAYAAALAGKYGLDPDVLRRRINP